MSEQWFENELSKQAKAKRLITVLLLFFLVVVIMSSCITQQKCFDKFGADTIQVVVKDTIYIPKETIKFSFKTLIDTLDVVDTFYIKQGRASGTFTRQDIKIECEPDTIYTETIVEVPIIQKADKKYWQFKEFWISISALVFLLIVLYLSRR
jgi:hypothetical protein